MPRKLVILHVDGLGADMLERAIAEGRMPFTRRLANEEGYTIHRYRCGVPSTTPFAQAGILYGDNSEIPSFRWWDRRQRIFVQFGARSTFKKVADRYFEGTHPLTRDGACIAACYPAGAADDFGISYHDRTYSQDERSRSAWRVVLPYVANPVHLGDWLAQTVRVAARTLPELASARAHGRHPARAYVASDVIEEIFVHHLTRYAVEKAMREGYSPIYAGFYAFDETAHAFGPSDAASMHILKHVDHTIARVAAARRHGYELVVLSDHGQVDTVPFRALTGRPLRDELAALLPGHRVEESGGKASGPAPEQAAGTLRLACSGGLAHVYVDSARRLAYRELVDRHPELARSLSALGPVAFVLARDGAEDVFIAGGAELRGDGVRDLLARYDEADVLRSQLSRLNSFQSSGELLLFGTFVDGGQVNFEDQAGGHGSVGGEQLHPFVFARRDWPLDCSDVRGAHELHPRLAALRDRLATAI